MSDAYTFEHDGHTIEYFPCTVRSQLGRNRYLSSIVTALGCETGEEARNNDPEEWENYKEFANGMSQCRTSAPWWVNSVSTPEEVLEAYNLFMKQGPDLYNKFVDANLATLPM